MSSDHFSDSQLQDILDGNIKPTRQQKAHLDSCRQCRQALDNYQVITQVMAEESEISLTADFANKVIQAIPETRNSPITVRRPAIGDGLIVFASVAAIIASALYFIDPVVIYNLSANLVDRFSLPESSFLMNIDSFLNWVGISPMMLFFTVLTIIIIGGIDQIISRQHRGQHTVSLLV